MQARRNELVRFVCAALILAASPLISSLAYAGHIGSRAAIERAVYYIDQGNFSLARSYLEIPLIDQRITTTERSRAYYLQGYSFEQQHWYRSAVQEYTKALAFNPANPATLTALGFLNYKGLGVTQDRPEAARLLTAAVQLDHPPAMTGLATLLLEGHGVERDIAAARELLLRAAQADHAAAYVVLGKSYRRPYAQPPDVPRARQYYEKALVLNQADALLALGHMHLNGEFQPADAGKAAKLFAQASARGLAAAQASLAYLYLIGSGVKQDLEQARILYAQAAEQGNAAAHHGLAYLLETQPTSAGEPKEAQGTASAAVRTHYLEAARAGYAPAQLALSRLANAAGDAQQALDWLRQAAQQGSVGAYNRLAWQLATDPRDALRNGQEAVLYADKALAATRSSATLDTLAAAYAEAARFKEAISTQRSALELLEREEQQRPASAAITPASSARPEFEARLQRYESGQPWREPLPASGATSTPPQTADDSAPGS